MILNEPAAGHQVYRIPLNSLIFFASFTNPLDLITLKLKCMYSYELLEPGCFYLIQEKESSPVTMIKVCLESDHCMYISVYGDAESIEWKRKTDPVFDIIELLSDNTVKQWQSLYNNNEDAFNYEEGEE